MTNWDQFLPEPEQDQVNGKPLQQLPATQPGKPHSATIVEARVVKKDFDWAKSDSNPDGQCLVMVLGVAGYHQFEATVPCHFHGKISAICRSARVPAPFRGGGWSEQCLVGRSVSIETDLAVSARGTEYVKVLRYLPQQEPLPPAQALPQHKKTSTRKADAPARAAAPDDIPF